MHFCNIDADNDSDGDDGALVDSDDEEEETSSSAGKKKAAPKKAKVLSKREKMEALQAKKRAAMDFGSSSSSSKSKKDGKRGDKQKRGDGAEKDGEKGYDSGDSYNSAQYVRTQEDDDFIDTRGEDEDLVAEYYADQHFEDERPDELEEMEVKERKRGGKRGGSSKKRGPDQLSEKDKKDKENPISMAVERMKKKKKVEKPFQEMLQSAQELITRMQDAAKEDDRSLKERKPGLKKLQMLPEVLDAMIDTKMMRPLLESEFLSVAKIWIQPLKDGSLGNVTLRQKMIDGIISMNREIDNDDLKRSNFGKLIMALYKHKKETPELKNKHKALIEQWSRRIFGKEGDMRNTGGAPMGRGDRGLVGIARAQAAAAASSESRSAKRGSGGINDGDLGSILSKGVKQARDMGRNRVRVPYSKGFQYSIRPENKTGDVADRKTRISNVKDQRESLHKKILEKNKRAPKNARSANISIEGRPAK